MHCQFCNTKLIPEPANARFAKCPNDGTLWNLHARPASYDADYFGKEYRDQYGKDYLEDKPALLKRMNLRFQLIQRFLPSPGAHLLEAGSSAGFFLEFFARQGYRATGWEISAEMVAYANQRGCHSTAGDLLELAGQYIQKGGAPFDIIVGFYVFEHIANQKKLWSYLSQLLNKGAVLIMSMPSIFGPVYLLDRNQFFFTHPVDHYIDYSVYSIKEIGRRFGFTLQMAAPEGIHPGRFPGGGLPAINNIYKELQHTLALSDTMLVVLRKN